MNHFRHLLIANSEHIFRSYVPRNSPLFQVARRTYWFLQGSSV
jgi:hypothetical protein